LLEEKLIDLLIEIRLKARDDRNFALADEIRDKLSALGVDIKDTKDGTKYIRNS
jgi:cysteinyl-tRNA synthetase